MKQGKIMKDYIYIQVNDGSGLALRIKNEATFQGIVRSLKECGSDAGAGMRKIFGDLAYGRLQGLFRATRLVDGEEDLNFSAQPLSVHFDGLILSGHVFSPDKGQEGLLSVTLPYKTIPRALIASYDQACEPEDPAPAGPC